MRTHYDGQFGAFDGLDNRRTMMELFASMSIGVPESVACIRRMEVLKSLIQFSQNCFADKMVELTPMSTIEAYFAFTAITGCLSVPVEVAAKHIEEVVRKQQYDRRDLIRCP